jgi:hypothetical protein
MIFLAIFLIRTFELQETNLSVLLFAFGFAGIRRGA